MRDQDRDRDNAVKAARDWLCRRPLFLDTETTGLGPDDQVVQVAVIDAGGKLLLDTLVKPTVAICPEAAAVHGITEAMVRQAPTFAEVYDRLERIMCGQWVAVYNVGFDLKLLRQSAKAHCLPMLGSPAGGLCVMELYAAYRGEWDDYHQSYRWQKLGEAARQCGISLPEHLHNARADAELCRRLTWAMAYTHLDGDNGWCHD